MLTISVLGSGWLGFPLIQSLQGQGYAVKASTRTRDRLSEISAIGSEPYFLDIDACVLESPEFLKCDLLIVNIPSKNVEGFQWLADQIALSEVKYILFISSTSVYQDKAQLIRETDTALLADTPLLQIENLFKAIPHVGTTILRMAGLIGPKRHPGRFFNNGKTLPNPNAPVNMIHLDDCVEIISAVIKQQHWNAVFNCCDDDHPSRQDFYCRAAKDLGLGMPTLGRNDERLGKIIDNTAMKKTLNYEFSKIGLLQRTNSSKYN